MESIGIHWGGAQMASTLLNWSAYCTPKRTPKLKQALQTVSQPIIQQTYDLILWYLPMLSSFSLQKPEAKGNEILDLAAQPFPRGAGIAR